MSETHAFVGGYEIDPSRPNECQICEKPRSAHEPASRDAAPAQGERPRLPTFGCTCVINCREHYTTAIEACKIHGGEPASPPVVPAHEGLRAEIEQRIEELDMWERSASEGFERLAAEFYEETRLIAPGKSVPMEMWSDDYEARRKAAWDTWRDERYKRVNQGLLRRCLAALSAEKPHKAGCVRRQAMEFCPPPEPLPECSCLSAEPPQTERWQLFNTAPYESGRFVIMCDDEGQVAEAYSRAAGYWRWVSNDTPIRNPKYWQLLPAPPAELGEKR